MGGNLFTRIDPDQARQVHWSFSLWLSCVLMVASRTLHLSLRVIGGLVIVGLGDV